MLNFFEIRLFLDLFEDLIKSFIVKSIKYVIPFHGMLSIMIFYLLKKVNLQYREVHQVKVNRTFVQRDLS